MRRWVTFKTPKMSHLDIERANPYVLTGGSPGRMLQIAEQLDKVDETVKSDYRGLVTVNGEYKGVPITAFSTGMGPASVSIVMPELIEACDSDYMVFVRVGTSGGLKDYLNAGDFVITTEAERHESTSDKIMYPGYRAFSNGDVRQTLLKRASLCSQGSAKVYEGRTKVVDDIYFDALNSAGEDHGDLLAVSMEFSVICALRDRYNRDDPTGPRRIKAGNLLMVSDNLVKEGDAKVEDRLEFEKKKDLLTKVHLKIGLETLVELSKKR